MTFRLNEKVDEHSRLQINGCAFGWPCTEALREAGERGDRLAVIAVNGANRLNTTFHNPPMPLTIDANERTKESLPTSGG